MALKNKNRLNIVSLTIQKWHLKFMLLFLLFGSVKSSFAQVYFLGNTGSYAGWYKLGRLQLPQGGFDAELRIVASNGYNASIDQNGESIIHFKTSNTNINVAGFYGAGSFYNTGRMKIVKNLKVIQIDQNTWDFYAVLPEFTGNGSILNILSINGGWTKDFGMVNPPANSIYADLKEELLFSSAVYFANNVGIGTAVPKEKLSVNGNIRAREIKVETSNWPDYVFADDYKISPLKDIASYIKIHKHLPEMPSAQTVASDGVALGEMNKLLVKKIEELTLHLIQKDKELTEEKAFNKDQEKRIERLESIMINHK